MPLQPYSPNRAGVLRDERVPVGRIDEHRAGADDDQHDRDLDDDDHRVDGRGLADAEDQQRASPRR